jgi:hypothetical protein
LTLAYDFEAFGSDPGDLREINEGRRNTEVGSFFDYFPKIFLLPTVVPVVAYLCARVRWEV